jgi:hypothetical protein
VPHLPDFAKARSRGIVWDSFNGEELSVKRSVWGTKKLAEKLEPGSSSVRGGVANEPKTKRSRASIPVVKQLADALETHRQRMGQLAVGPIFQGGTGKPLNLDNLVKRAIEPALSHCVVCGKLESKHKPGDTFSSATRRSHSGTAGVLSGAALRQTFMPGRG